MDNLDFQYNFMGNSIFIYYKDERFIINKGDLRFEKLNQIIKNNDRSIDLEKVLNFKEVLPKKIYEKDNAFYIEDKKISDDLLIPLKGNLEAFQNFYLNLEKSNHFDKEKSWEVYKSLKTELIPFSSSGFVFIINNEDKKDLSDTPFYSLDNEELKKELKSGLENLLLNNFGSSSKKLKKLIQSRLFSNQSSVNCSCLYLLKAARNILSVSELITLLEESNVVDWFDKKSIAGFKSFIPFYFKSSERKMRFLKEKIKPRLFYCFDRTKSNMIPFEKFKTNEEIYNKIMNNYYMYNLDTAEAEILNHYPVLKEISGEEICSSYSIDYPKNTEEFQSWKETMNNCLQTRSFDYFSGKKLILGLKDKEDELRFVLEIRSNKQIGDFEGRDKVKVPNNIDYALRKKLKEFDIIE